MVAAFPLLRLIGKAALPFLSSGTSYYVEIGSSIVAQVWEWWKEKTKEADRRQELAALARLTAREVLESVRGLVQDLAPGEPHAVQARLAGYLGAVPAQVCRTLRRPADPTGRTVPAELALARMESLAAMLPSRPPRFNGGDRVVGTDYELVELLGLGGFGEVWKARNVFMGDAHPVALKFCIDPEAARTLRRETALLGRIQKEGHHPGIVQLRNTYLSADPPFLEYELVEGGDLGGLILDWHRKPDGPSPEQAARLIRRLGEIMAYAHARGIVHRDLKPANVLVELNDGKARFKIADFGIGGIAVESAGRAARQTRLSHTLSATVANGSYSLYYASPEQVRGASPDPRDDVHALGVIWYQILVGDLAAEPPRGPGWKKRFLAKGMCPAWIDLLEACVSSEREDRPADAGVIAGKLGRSARDSASEPPAGGPVVMPALPPGPVASPPAPPGPPAPVMPGDDPPEPPAPGPPASCTTERRAELVTRLRAHRRNLMPRSSKLMRGARLVLAMALVFAAVGWVISWPAHALFDWLYETQVQGPTTVLVAASGFEVRGMSEHSYWHKVYLSELSFVPSGLPAESKWVAQPGPAGTFGKVTATDDRRQGDVNYTRYKVASWRQSESSVLSWQGPDGEKLSTQGLIEKLNAALKEAAGAYDRRLKMRDRWALTTSLFCGALAAGGACVAYLMARRARGMTRAASLRTAAEALQNEFSAELAQLGGPFDLTDPARARDLIRALDGRGPAPS